MLFIEFLGLFSLRSRRHLALCLFYLSLRNRQPFLFWMWLTCWRQWRTIPRGNAAYTQLGSEKTRAEYGRDKCKHPEAEVFCRLNTNLDFKRDVKAILMSSYTRKQLFQHKYLLWQWSRMKCYYLMFTFVIKDKNVSVVFDSARVKWRKIWRTTHSDWRNVSDDVDDTVIWMNAHVGWFINLPAFTFRYL